MRFIRCSLVTPFQFATALDTLHAVSLPNAGFVLAALSAALDVSPENVPRFEGRTVVVLDSSGSMMDRPI